MLVIPQIGSDCQILKNWFGCVAMGYRVSSASLTSTAVMSRQLDNFAAMPDEFVTLHNDIAHLMNR